MDPNAALTELLNNHVDVQFNLTRKETILQTIEFKQALISANGCLATWTPCESTGRSPKDTMIVRHADTESHIDWDSPNNLPLDDDTFIRLWQTAIETLKRKKRIFVSNRVIGADVSYALPVETITDSPLTMLFTMNMFRPMPGEIRKSVFAKSGFKLIVLPYDKLNQGKFKGRLRQLENGKTTQMAIVMDFNRRLGLVYGSSYCGSVKKLMFTVMNYYLPQVNILPLHCSANENTQGELALFLGLSGTGKTTLSTDPKRALLGDDEHGWSNNGIANFEFGCYAKLIDLDSRKEPEIYNAVFHRDEFTKHGAIVENAMMFPNGEFDLSDDRFTPNSRASYPLSFLTNIKLSSTGPHPKTIIFLTADANGVLPPVARLSSDQAMLWFLMGYTSKLAGTETGIIEPISTFSRFFGQPFMPCLPDVYAALLGKRLKKHGTQVYLINTGWSGGPYGEGKRMDIHLTRVLVNAALDGTLENVQYKHDLLFHLDVPQICPGVPEKMLDPIMTWKDKQAYEERARKLADDFSRHFDQAYGNKNIDAKVRAQCPAK